MSEEDYKKVIPFETVQEVYRIYDQEMELYRDPDTKLLKEELAIRYTSCPCCGSPVAQSKQIFTKDVFHYEQCQNCEHVYVNPRLNDEYIHRLYTTGRCMYQLKNLYLPTAPYRSKTLYTRKLTELEEKFGKGKLLDFGCSTGYFLKTALERGWEAHGVELNPFAVQWARDELNIDTVHDKLLEECNFEDHSFEMVTMWDVLEHLTDPADILSQLKQYLKPGGVIVIETSHYDCTETDLLKEKNTNFAGDMHIMHFTKKSLGELLTRTGFHSIEFEIFGLDIKHVADYHKHIESDAFCIPDEYIEPLQTAVDAAGKGCYIKAYGRI